jgi:hypothetical protein
MPFESFHPLLSISSVAALKPYVTDNVTAARLLKVLEARENKPTNVTIALKNFWRPEDPGQPSAI